MERRYAHCLDCRVDTLATRDWYMVHDELWREVITHKDPPTNRFLCVACFERRLGRELKPSDFMDAPVNVPNSKLMSALLLDRLTAAE